VIGRQCQHHRIGVAALGECRCGGHRRAGIAAHRLDHDGRVDTDILGLPACKNRKSDPVMTIGAANRLPSPSATRSRVS